MNDKIDEAIALSKKAHMGQKRKVTGEDYVEHPIRVAELVCILKYSANIELLIIASILHDTVEDTNITLKEIADKFGYKAASIVEELTSDTEKIKSMGKKEYLSEKMLTMSSYGLVVKLIDRLHNLSDLEKGSSFAHKTVIDTEFILEKIKTRKLSETHRKIIKLIENKISELK
jgi:GTP pyrophosphokinase